MIKIKTFRAKNLQLALALVREELGPDAAVLATRDIRGLFGIGGKQIEVTASSSIRVPSRLPASTDATVSDVDDKSSTLREASKGPTQQKAQGGVPSKAIPSSGNGPISQMNSPSMFDANAKRQTDQLESMARKAIRSQAQSASPSQSLSPSVPEPRSTKGTDHRYVDLMNDMLHCGFDPAWARHLLHVAEQSLTEEQWKDPMHVRGKLAHWVQSQIAIAPPIELPDREKPYVVAMVGPTGVGKTTTLAKLAAAFTLEEKIQVGLVTIDTFRIGAVEQLRKYADIMSLPMSVVESESAMESSMRQLSNCRLIFIDTAGRTPRDTTQLDSLKRMLSVAQVDEVHLVLSATTSPGSFQDALHRYSVVQPNRMVLSKLDEVRGLGELFPMLRQAKLPINYVTTGQNVPKDIEPAIKMRLAAFMLGNR